MNPRHGEWQLVSCTISCLLLIGVGMKKWGSNYEENIEIYSQTIKPDPITDIGLELSGQPKLG